MASEGCCKISITCPCSTGSLAFTAPKSRTLQASVRSLEIARSCPRLHRMMSSLHHRVLACNNSDVQVSQVIVAAVEGTAVWGMHF